MDAGPEDTACQLAAAGEEGEVKARDVEQIRPGPYPNYRFLILGFLGLANVLNSLIVLSLGILLPSISDDLGLSPLEQGLLASSMFFGSLLMALPASVWLSRFNAKGVLMVAMFLGAAFVFVQGWAPVFLVMLAGRLAFGLAMVARQPARAILTAQWFPAREIVVVNGVVNSTYGLAAVVGFLLTPYLLLWLDNSWRTTLTVYAIAFVVIAIAWAVFGKERRIAKRKESAIPVEGSLLRSLFRYRDVWIVSLGMVGALVMEYALLTFWPTLLLEKHGIPLTTSGSMLFVAAVSESVGSMLLAFNLMRPERRRLKKLMVIVLATTLVASAVGMMTTGSVPLQFLLVALHGLGFSFIPIIWTIPFEQPGITPREIAVATGLIETASRGGGIAGPIVAGFFHQATGDLSLSLVITSLFGVSMATAGLLISGPRAQEMPAT